MIQERLILAEGFTNIIAGAGLWFYLVTILMNRTRSLLERRLCFMLAVVGTLFVTRGIGYSFTLSTTLSPYIFFLSTIFPITAVLFVEGLLRQHSPLSLKILSFAGTFTLGGFALILQPGNLYFHAALMAYQGIVLIWLSYLTITRDKTSLSEAENRLINGVSIACGIAVPLLISDYRSIFGWEFMRLGALGGLVFCLSTIKFSEKTSKREVAKEFAHILLTDLLGTVLFCLIWNDFVYFWIAYVTFMTMHLLILILKELTQKQDPKIQQWIFTLLEAIEKNQIQSVKDIHNLLTSKLGDNSLIFIDEENLQSYDIEALREYMKDKGELSRTQLRKEQKSQAAQHLVYALEANQMNHIFVITTSPLLLVLTNAPSIKGSVAYEREMKILKSFIHLLQRKSLHE